MSDPVLDPLLDRAAAGGGPVVVLTGAGISAESGIPTFRGPEGYWRVGSRHYRPMELATRAAFEAMPDEVWGWYLYRRAVCRAAQPNAAHRALAALEQALGDRFLLVTQNVDGLHLRAGNTPARTYRIHGDLDLMRCAAGCSRELLPVPAALGDAWEDGRLPGPRERALLTCPRCGGRTRPHVLWFDECYDEAWFRFDSSLRAAAAASLLVVIGTSGATTLPVRMCEVAAARRTPMLVVDPEPTPFAALAEGSGAGRFLQGRAGVLVPPLAERIAARLAR
ncbi:MAG TPA: Sir2 family NAD-dependent protein deacetylase [Thermodesulfobacteriota bacterium]|nr:Sir2 family NAD-dependent protein deacetylase [Thermodesulfobacteriota bacterium]